MTGREGGGYKMVGGGGHVRFYPYKRGVEKVLVVRKEGGHNKFWGSFYVVD